MLAYVGSRTTRERNARGHGITVYQIDLSTASFDPVQVMTDLVNPSYLAINRSGKTLYCVHGDGSEASAFNVDPASGALRLLNRQGTRGENPVHLALDPSERFLLVTNHLGSSIAVLPVQPDGALQPVRQVMTVAGPIGPHRVEQQQAKPHFNTFDPSGRFAIVPDKGLDRVFSFRFELGELTPAAQPFVGTREGAGPRHLDFHPALPIAYVVNELDSTVTTYRLDRETGGLQPFDVVSTLPRDFTGNSRAAAIKVDRTGRFLYASNRGHDSIAIFAVDQASGRLTFNRTQPSGGAKPRSFALSPEGAWLFALNEDSDSIVPFRVDPDCGDIEATGQSVFSGSPTCMIFANDPQAVRR